MVSMVTIFFHIDIFDEVFLYIFLFYEQRDSKSSQPYERVTFSSPIPRMYTTYLKETPQVCTKLAPPSVAESKCTPINQTVTRVGGLLFATLPKCEAIKRIHSIKEILSFFM